MSIEDGGPKDYIIEEVEGEVEDCPCCETNNWLRAIAAYERGTCWVIYCADCGRTAEERWNILP